MTTADAAVTQIAQNKLGIKTLETQNRDRDDFHDISSACLRAALLAAYEAGRRSTQPKYGPKPLGEILIGDDAFTAHNNQKSGK